jgi:LemA protein
MGLIVLGGIAALLVLAISSYNGLLRRRNRVEQAYSTIDVQLTQRYDLVVKLVETVKQYMGHERSLLEDITRLRARAIQSRTPEAKLSADNELSRALGQLNVSVENYPQLRSSENFVQLQRSLNEVEEQIAAARRAYNGAVVDYNNAVQTFPNSLIAGSMGFGTRQVFTADERKRGDVDMKRLFA